MKKHIQLLLTGLLLSAGVFAQNNALDFDGTNDYVSIGTILSNNASFTKEAWVYADINTGNRNIISSDGTAFWVNGGYLKAGINDVHNEVTSTSTFPTGEWQHVAVTFDDAANTMNLYINGSLDVSNTNVTSSFDGDPLYIGDHKGNGSAIFNGKIDDVRIWDDVRTQVEIKANMHTELAGTESNLVAYYKFNETSGTTASDETSNSNDGTLTNMDGSTDWVSTNLYAQNYALDFDGTNDYELCP